jgi:hypothetical protein
MPVNKIKVPWHIHVYFFHGLGYSFIRGCAMYSLQKESQQHNTLGGGVKRMVPDAHLQLRVQAVDGGQRPPQLHIFVSGSVRQLHPSTREEGVEAEWTKTNEVL